MPKPKADPVKPIDARYEGRIRTLLGKIATVFATDGWRHVGSVSRTADAQFEYEQFMSHPDGRKLLIRFEISEARHYDSDGPADGIAFAVSMSGPTGDPDIFYAPHNMSGDLWVRAGDAVATETRFAEIEATDWRNLVGWIEWRR